MCSPFVLDKDGVSAAAIAGEMISYLSTKQTSLSQQLTAIFEEWDLHTQHTHLWINWNRNPEWLCFFRLFHLSTRYGYHISKNSYFICHDQNVVRGLFERLRNYNGEKDTYPKECGRFSISAIRDLTTGYDSNQPDNKAVGFHSRGQKQRRHSLQQTLWERRQHLSFNPQFTPIASAAGLRCVGGAALKPLRTISHQTRFRAAGGVERGGSIGSREDRMIFLNLFNLI